MLTYCGFIAIVGRPNVGKSTLMNHLIGQKISITSRKPQTTRNKVTGVTTLENYQYIFVDTPGFQKKYISKLNTALNQSVMNSLAEVDVILWVVEAGIYNKGDQEVLKLLPQNACVILVINKRDQLKSSQEFSKYRDHLASLFSFATIVDTSAKHHVGMNELLNLIKPHLPESVLLYPSDQLTDKSSKFLASEIIREKLFRYLGEELPYSLTVDIESFIEEESLYKIHALIIVDKENQKGIVVGKKGAKLKQILIAAREDMEILFGIKVFLNVWVKVRSGFADEAKFLQQFQ